LWLWIAPGALSLAQLICDDDDAIWAGLRQKPGRTRNFGEIGKQTTKKHLAVIEGGF
jgi:hypothetical protein